MDDEHTRNLKFLQQECVRVTEEMKVIEESVIELQSVCSIMKTALENIRDNPSCIAPSLVAETALVEVIPYALRIASIIVKHERKSNA